MGAGDGAQHSVASTEVTDVSIPRPSSGRVFEAVRPIRLADASARGRLRLDACARYLQDIANDDARDAGTPNFTAWVARRTTIRVERFPEYLDALALATWCSGIGPRWAERRYTVRGFGDDAGAIDAVTLWVHIDMATMKPIAVPEGFAEQYGAAAQGRTVRARLHLPTRPPMERTLVQTPWPLRFVDFDVLGHVNNSVYWQIVEEQLAGRPSVRAPMTITLEHHDAIDRGAEVTVAVAEQSGGFDAWVTADERVAAVVSARAL